MKVRLLAAVCFVVVGSVGQSWALAPNEALPAVQVHDAAGKPAAILEEKSKLTYVDFWASWCPPCQESLPWMKTLVDRYGPRGLDVVGISLDRERSAADKSIKRVAPNFRVLFDPEGSAAKAFGIPTMPTSYLVDDQGRVRIIHRGFRASDKLELEREIESLLSGAR